MVTAAAPETPPPLLAQLKPGGRMIIPVDNRSGFQDLVLVGKDADGTVRREEILPVILVPLTGER